MGEKYAGPGTVLASVIRRPEHEISVELIYSSVRHPNVHIWILLTRTST
jgi:protein-S-isoprenylcysteine O-methyltransferase Ste14